MNYPIVLEGIDGSGKSATAARLAQYYRDQSQEVELFRDPGSTRAAEKIREILLDPEVELSAEQQVLLFTAARAGLSEHVRHALEAGRIVILDRWYFSTLSYQGPLIEDPRAIYDLSDTYAHIPMAKSRCLLLSITLEEAERRRVARDETVDRFEGADYSAKAKRREVYEDLADRERLTRIDCNGLNEEEQFQAVLHHLQTL